MKFKARSIFVVLAVALGCLAPGAPAALANAGDLDGTFGSGGISMLPPTAGSHDGTITSIATQSDGKIVVLRNGYDDPRVPGVKRLNSNGAIDTTFGTNGTFTFAPHPLRWTWGVQLQQDQKIVFAGLYDAGTVDKEVIVRLNTDGTLDTDADSTPASCFGPGCSGYITVDEDFAGLALYDFAARDDGDVIVAGNYFDGSQWRATLNRFDESGAPDAAYDTNAASAIGSFRPGVVGTARVLLTEDQNEAVLAVISNDDQFAALRFDNAGNSVATWGTNGIATVGDGMEMRDASMRNGVVTFAGSTYMNSADPVIAQLDASGHVPAAYGEAGVARVHLQAGEMGGVSSVEPTADGRTLALLDVGAPPMFLHYTSTAMFAADGSLDSTYGSGGIVKYPALASASPEDMALLPSGKALLGGYVPDGTGYFPGFIARAYGTLEPPFTRLKDGAPQAQIPAPPSSKISSANSRKFAGTAGPVGKVRKVEISLRRVDGALLKNKKRCLWLRNSKAKFKRVSATNKKCSRPRWLKARGGESWSYKLRRSLPKGSYVLSVRVTATDGAVQAKPTVKKFTVT